MTLRDIVIAHKDTKQRCLRIKPLTCGRFAGRAARDRHDLIILPVAMKEAERPMLQDD